MRVRVFVFVLATFVANLGVAFGHGPQLQITSDAGRIVTREIQRDGPYSDRLTDAKNLYVMPALEYLGAWYTRPNTESDALDPSLPAFYSGPGFAYGYDQAVGGRQAFVEGSLLQLQFVSGLKAWNGSAFVDAGDVQLEMFSGARSARSADSVASAAFDLSTSPIASGYGSEGAEIHNTVRYRFLGDGVATSVPPPDGIYLIDLQLLSTDPAMAASDPFQYVMVKNASAMTVADAVESLQVDPALVQYVPEPAACWMSVVAFLALTAIRR